MEDILKLLKGIGIFIMIAPPIIGLLMIATGNGSSDGGSWKQKRERYERERCERLFKEEQQKKLQENAIRYQSLPAAQPVYSNRSSRNNYAELWDECEDLEAALNDAGIDHDDLSYPMEYHELKDLRDEYQSLLEDNDIDY
jgi:hypothetical protein